MLDEFEKNKKIFLPYSISSIKLSFINRFSIKKSGQESVNFLIDCNYNSLIFFTFFIVSICGDSRHRRVIWFPITFSALDCLQHTKIERNKTLMTFSSMFRAASFVPHLARFSLPLSLLVSITKHAADKKVSKIFSLLSTPSEVSNVFGFGHRSLVCILILAKNLSRLIKCPFAAMHM